MIKYVFLGVMIGLVLVVGAWWQEGPWTETSMGVQIGETTYTLEVADDAREQALGLGERDSLCDRCGMVFFFATTEKHTFWMKGMRFPLDIAWLEDGTIVHIERHVSEKSEDIYRPETAANAVLEFQAGTLESVSVGEKVHFLFDSPR